MKYPSSIYIITSLVVFTALILVLFYYARKVIGKTNLYIISNLLLLSLGINFISLFVLIMTYNKVKLTPGIIGPKGLRGNIGNRGLDKEVEQCSKQNRNLGETYIKEEKDDLIRIQKPVMYKND